MFRSTEIIRLAAPCILSNISVPLLNLIDLAIVGHLRGGGSIAAYALVSMVFNVLYWAFIFLRTSASGYTAQASGQADRGKTIRLLILLSGLSAFLSLAILLLRVPLIDLTLRLVDGGAGLKALVRSYFLVRIWMIPAFLLLQTFKGWLIGMQDMVSAMILTLMVSVFNILFNLLFVFRLRLGLEGVAWAAVTAYTVTAFTAVCILAHKYHIQTRKWYVVLPKEILNRSGQRVLIADDCVMGGTFINELKTILCNNGYKPEQIRTCSIVTSQFSIDQDIEPDYYWKIIDSDFFFPWGKAK